MKLEIEITQQDLNNYIFVSSIIYSKITKIHDMDGFSFVRKIVNRSQDYNETKIMPAITTKEVKPFIFTVYLTGVELAKLIKMKLLGK